MIIWGIESGMECLDEFDPLADFMIRLLKLNFTHHLLRTHGHFGVNALSNTYDIDYDTYLSPQQR